VKRSHQPLDMALNIIWSIQLIEEYQFYKPNNNRWPYPMGMATWLLSSSFFLYLKILFDFLVKIII